MRNFIISTICISVFISFSALANVAVIVNTANANALTDKEISRIFLGKNKKFSNGDTVMAANLKNGNAARDEFEKKVLKKTSYQVKSYWAKLMFSGKAKPLKELVSDTDVLSFVAANPNAIAYIDASKVSDKVKVVKTF
jgi:ABC-type phosphate transport system substrate-binding protein